MSDSTFTQALAAAHGGHASSTAPAGPTDFAAAMRTQRDVTEALGESLAGWKLGFSPDGVPVAAPLYASLVRASPATMRLPEGGFIIEIELAFRLARDLPTKAYTRDEVLAAVDEALIGIELVRGRFGEPPAAPYPAFLADNIGNAGYVTGETTRSFRAFDLKALRCTFSVDGSIVQDGKGGHPQGDPVEPLRAYASAPIDELGGLKAGQVVTTGSLIKPLRVDRVSRIEAAIEGVGGISLSLTR